MKKSIYKIITVSLIIALNWSGLSAIGYTLASFSDVEDSTGNSWTAGSLDISSSSAGDFNPDITPYQTATRSVNITNDGSFNFDYALTIENIGTDVDLCDKVILDLDRDGVPIYSGTLAAFNVATSTLNAGDPDQVLDLEITLNSEEVSLWLKTCSFNLVATAFQTDKMDASEGFSDIETISNAVSSDAWGVVMNEVLPDPTGADDALMPNGEWVELYNNDSFAHDLTGWRIQDLENNKIDITAINTDLGTTVIAAGGYLVVYMNAEVLNNNGVETVALVDNNDDFQDVYTYFGPVPENKTNARIPDGTGDWVDPVPTPGAPNIYDPEFDLLAMENLEMKLLALMEEYTYEEQEYEINPNLTPTTTPLMSSEENLPVSEVTVDNATTTPSEVPANQTTSTPVIIGDETNTDQNLSQDESSGQTEGEPEPALETEPVDETQPNTNLNDDQEPTTELETELETESLTDESETTGETQTDTDPEVNNQPAIETNPTPDDPCSVPEETEVNNSESNQNTQSNEPTLMIEPPMENIDQTESEQSIEMPNQTEVQSEVSTEISDNTTPEVSPEQFISNPAPAIIETAPAPVPVATPDTAPVEAVPAVVSAPVTAPAVTNGPDTGDQ